jgi:rRNA processing protein Gar1
MSQLTLQEVIDRINQVYFSVETRRAKDDHARDQKHRPEFYIPRITRRLARFVFSIGPVQLRSRV